MLPKIAISEKLFSKEYYLTKDINELIQSINSNKIKDPAKALFKLTKLKLWYQKNGTMVSNAVVEWFANNSLNDLEEELEKRIRSSHLKLKIEELATSEKIKTLYEDSLTDGMTKADFCALVQNFFGVTKEQVYDLSASNDAVIKVILDLDDEENSVVVVRFLPVSRAEDKLNISQISARERLKGISEVPQPFICEKAGEGTLQRTYLEISKYYKAGNILNHFNHLRNSCASSSLSKAIMSQELLRVCSDLLTLMIYANKLKIWLTDLKPENILVDENGQLKISDIKGLVISPRALIAINRTNSTEDYYNTGSVFTDDNQMQLNLLQCQTLASTLYAIIEGEKAGKNKHGKLDFKFTHPYFLSPMGKFFKDLIQDLMSNKVNELTNKRNTTLEIFLQRVEANMTTKPSRFIVDEVEGNLSQSKLSLTSSSSPKPSPNASPSSSPKMKMSFNSNLQSKTSRTFCPKTGFNSSLVPKSSPSSSPRRRSKLELNAKLSPRPSPRPSPSSSPNSNSSLTSNITPDPSPRQNEDSNSNSNSL